MKLFYPDYSLSQTRVNTSATGIPAAGIPMREQINKLGIL